jgi:hypothetical protein
LSQLNNNFETAPQKYFDVAFEHWHCGAKQGRRDDGMGRSERNRMGSLMKKFVIVMASTIGVAGAAVAADMPIRQPPPPTPVVGKAPIGKAPIGKAPIGKAPIGKAPGPIVTRG